MDHRPGFVTRETGLSDVAGGSDKSPYGIPWQFAPWQFDR